MHLLSLLNQLRIPLIIGAICLLGGMLLQFTHSRVWTDDGIVEDHLTGDSDIFFAAARDVQQRHSPFHPSGSSEHPGSLYCYPPLLAVLLSPLAGLPLLAQNLVWYAIITFSFAGSFFLLHRIAQIAGFAPPRGWSLVAFSIAFLMFFEPVQNNFLYAQANGPILLCALLFLDLFLRRWPKLAAVCAALGGALKMFPLIFFPFLFWRRRWGALLCGLAALAAFSSLSFLFAPDGYYHDYLWALRARAGSSYGYAEFFATLYRSVIWFIPALSSKLAELACAGALMLTLMLFDLRWKARDRATRERGTVWTLLILCNFILMIHPHTESHVMVFCIPAFVLSGIWAVFRGTLRQRVLFGVSYLSEVRT